MIEWQALSDSKVEHQSIKRPHTNAIGAKESKD